MSGDLTGLCLYILQVKPIGNYKVRESACPKQKEFWDIMRYNVQFWDTTQQRISLRYFKLFQASWDQLMSPISPVVFKNLMIYYFKVSKIQKRNKSVGQLFSLANGFIQSCVGVWSLDVL